MSPLFEAAHELHLFLRRRKWKYCMIGGVAILRWGEQRATTDVDITLCTGFGNEDPFIDALLERFESRIPDAKNFALMNRVLVCQASNGTGIDIALGGLPFEQRLIDRSSSHTFAPRRKWITASAEDMIVLKAFADRDHDWVDVKGILRRQTPRLDWDQIVAELEQFRDLKDDWTGMERLIAMRKQVEREVRQ